MQVFFLSSSLPLLKEQGKPGNWHWLKHLETEELVQSLKNPGIMNDTVSIYLGITARDISLLTNRLGFIC